MKYLRNFKESVFKNLKEDIEDCLLHLSDIFESRDDSIKDCFHYVFKITGYALDESTEISINKMLSELQRTLSGLKLIDGEAYFDIAFDGRNKDITKLDKRKWEKYNGDRVTIKALEDDKVFFTMFKDFDKFKIASIDLSKFLSKNDYIVALNLIIK